MSAGDIGKGSATGLLGIAKLAISVAAVIASALFLIAAFRGSWRELGTIAAHEGIFATVFLLSIGYGGAYFLLAVAWHRILGQMARIDVPFGASAYVYCLANIAKYVPGSVFHFAGRQLLGARVGWKQADIARATVLEIGANVTAVAAIIALAIAFSPDLVPDDLISTFWWLSAMPVRTAALVLLAFGIAGFAVLSRTGPFLRAVGVNGSTVWRVLALNFMFFLSNGALAMLLAAQVAGNTEIPLQTFGVAYLIAWLAGFIIPGAPGGIGVRESVLVLLLAGHAGGEAAGLALGIGMRAVTILGDVFSGALAYWLGRNFPQLSRT